jgi:hypothetical protein
MLTVNLLPPTYSFVVILLVGVVVFVLAVTTGTVLLIMGVVFKKFWIFLNSEHS